MKIQVLASVLMILWRGAAATVEQATTAEVATDQVRAVGTPAFPALAERDLRLAFEYPFDPAAATKMIIEIRPDQSGLLTAGEDFTVTTTDRSPIRVLDLRGRVVYAGPVPKALNLSAGYYAFECPSNDREQVFVRPADYHGASFLGAELHYVPVYRQRADLMHPAYTRAALNGMGLRPEAANSLADLDWTHADKLMRSYTDQKMKIIVSVNLRPKYAQEDLKNERSKHYPELCAAVVNRYADQVATAGGELIMEIWNEPGDSLVDKGKHDWWGDRHWTEYYVELFTNAVTAMKATGKKFTLAGPAWANNMATGACTDAKPFFKDGVNPNEVLEKAGVLNQLDAYSYHYYNTGWKPVDEPSKQAEWMDSNALMKEGFPPLDVQVQNLREVIGDKRILVDEFGIYGGYPSGTALGFPTTNQDAPCFITWSRGMFRAVKAIVLYRSKGEVVVVPHVIWSDGNIRASNGGLNLNYLGFEQGPRGPHPKTAAFLMACHWLDKAVFADRRVVNDNILLYAFRKGDKPVTFAWCLEGTTARLQRRNAYPVADIFGTPIVVGILGEEPVLFAASVEKVATLWKTGK